jgi:purine-binding chemotaxis protein CheW
MECLVDELIPKQNPDPAFEDEDFYEKEYKRKEPGVQVVCIRLNGEWYAAEISKAIEVIRVNQLTYLPSAPSYIAGIINVRGNILSVTDLKNLFGLSSEPLTDKSRIVVVASGGIETGLLVDEVAHVVDVPMNRIDPPLNTLTPEKAHYLKGQFRLENQLTSVLNIENIITKTKTQT